MNYQPKYDTIEGITEYLKDLAGLNKLQHERHEAGYDRRERLHDFIVLGRWSLDTCGNFGKILSENGWSIIPAQAIGSCPVVMTQDQVFARLGSEAHISSGMNSDIPPEYVKCSICEQPWTIKNAHDCISNSNMEVINASPFVGALLSNINKLPQYIDVAPHYVSHDTVRPKHLDKGSVCVDKDNIIKGGDSIFVTVWNYKHEECHQLSIIQCSLKEMTEAINNTGLLGEFNLIMIKNQYYPGDKEPWYRLQFKTPTGNHEITIGWRKRVINIDWSKSGKDLKHLFANENVTKESFLIHAYGYEKATEYLKKIIPAL